MKLKKIISIFLVYLMCLNNLVFIYANQEKESKIKNTLDNNIEKERPNLKTYDNDDIVSQDGFVFDLSTGTIIDYYPDHISSFSAVSIVANKIVNTKVDISESDNLNIADFMLSTGSSLFIPSEIMGVRVDAIGNSAFYNLYHLTYIVIPEGVTKIGNWAFYNCYNLRNIVIPDSVEYIGDEAFNYCALDINLNISKNVNHIGIRAFGEKIKNFNVDKKNKYYCDDNGVLFNKNKTELIQFPAGKNISSYKVPIGIKYIRDCAFYNCDNLTNIEISDSVTNIGNYTFASCSDLTNIKMPDNMTSIGYEAFANCYNLTSIRIPDGVTNIGNYTFYSCYNLTNIKLPNSVTSIGNSAFYNCDNLTNIELPNSLESIGYSAFYDCDKLREVKILNKNLYLPYDLFYYCYNIDSVYCYKNSTADNPNNFPHSNVTFYYLDDESSSENKKAKLTVSSAECKTGEFVDIYVNIKENPGVAVYNLKINFDKSKLTPVSISQGINGGDRITSNLNEPDIKLENLNYVTALWTNFSNMNYNGYLFKLRFKAKENIAFSNVPITLECTEEGLLDENYKEVIPEIQNGNITIKTNYDFGDINMDRNINNIDLLMLNQYIAEYNNIKFDDAQKYLADVYRDEIINVADLVLFKQYLAGWKVELGKDIQNSLSIYDNKSIKLNLKNTYISEDEIKISAVLNDNPGISAFKFILNYDDSILEPVFIKKGDIIKEGDIMSNINSNNKNYITALWSNATDINDNGSIFEVTFKIKDKQKDITNLGLTFDERDIINQTFEKISADNINKKIYLTPPDENFVYGDIDGDKIITANDAALILQYVLNSENIKFNDTQIRAAMVSDSSSVITTEDIIHILKKALDYDYVFPVAENSL